MKNAGILVGTALAKSSPYMSERSIQTIGALTAYFELKGRGSLTLETLSEGQLVCGSLASYRSARSIGIPKMTYLGSAKAEGGARD